MYWYYALWKGENQIEKNWNFKKMQKWWEEGVCYFLCWRISRIASLYIPWVRNSREGTLKMNDSMRSLRVAEYPNLGLKSWVHCSSCIILKKRFSRIITHQKLFPCCFLPLNYYIILHYENTLSWLIISISNEKKIHLGGAAQNLNSLHMPLFLFPPSIFTILLMCVCIICVCAHVLSHVSLRPLSVVLSQEEMIEWVAISSSRGIFLTKGLNSHLLHWRADSLILSHLGSPIILLKQLYMWRQESAILLNLS